MVVAVVLVIGLTGCSGKPEQADIPKDLNLPIPKPMTGGSGGDQPAKNKKQPPGAKAE